MAATPEHGSKIIKPSDIYPARALVYEKEGIEWNVGIDVRLETELKSQVRTSYDSALAQGKTPLTHGVYNGMVSLNEQAGEEPVNIGSVAEYAHVRSTVGESGNLVGIEERRKTLHRELSKKGITLSEETIEACCEQSGRLVEMFEYALDLDRGQLLDYLSDNQEMSMEARKFFYRAILIQCLVDHARDYYQESGKLQEGEVLRLGDVYDSSVSIVAPGSSHYTVLLGGKTVQVPRVTRDFSDIDFRSAVATEGRQRISIRARIRSVVRLLNNTTVVQRAKKGLRIAEGKLKAPEISAWSPAQLLNHIKMEEFGVKVVHWLGKHKWADAIMDVTYPHIEGEDFSLVSTLGYPTFTDNKTSLLFSVGMKLEDGSIKLVYDTVVVQHQGNSLQQEAEVSSPVHRGTLRERVSFWEDWGLRPYITDYRSVLWGVFVRAMEVWDDVQTIELHDLVQPSLLFRFGRLALRMSSYVTVFPLGKMLLQNPFSGEQIVQHYFQYFIKRLHEIFEKVVERDPNYKERNFMEIDLAEEFDNFHPNTQRIIRWLVQVVETMGIPSMTNTVLGSVRGNMEDVPVWIDNLTIHEHLNILLFPEDPSQILQGYATRGASEVLAFVPGTRVKNPMIGTLRFFSGTNIQEMETSIENYFEAAKVQAQIKEKLAAAVGELLRGLGPGVYRQASDLFGSFRAEILVKHGFVSNDKNR